LKPYYEHAGITIYHGDCRDVLLALPGPVDAVLTDPPYNVGFKYESHDDAMPEPDYLDFLRVVWVLCEALEARSIVWFWQGIRVANGQARAILPSGWHIHHLAAWFRREFAGDMWKGGHPAFTWEPIIWAALGEVKFSGPKGGHEGRDCLIGNSSRHDRDAKGHPCNKTLSVVKAVASWLEGPMICDPFCGSGTTLVAAKKAGKSAIGIEIEEKYCEIAAKRLSQEVFQFESEGKE
jgi:site-specific DNA-methyltransferase (adenine-specific)